jgi:hypothetical protein
MPTHLPVGPDERSHSIDLPVQLIGRVIRRELSDRVGRALAETSSDGDGVVVDQVLRRRLVGAWLRAQFAVIPRAFLDTPAPVGGTEA